MRTQPSLPGLFFLGFCVLGAPALLLGQPPRPDDAAQPYPVAAPTDRWREALNAIVALGPVGGGTAAPGPDAPADRLIWTVLTDAHGRVRRIEPLEQKAGARGLGKPKPASLAALAKRSDLPAHDAAVLRAIKKLPYGGRLTLDKTQAVQALVAQENGDREVLYREIARANGHPEWEAEVRSTFAQRWMVPRLSRFAAACPDVALRLAGDMSNIDGPGNGPEAMLGSARDSGNAVAVRFGTGSYPGFHSDLLLQPEYVLVCSPELLARCGPMAAPADLGQQILIHDESIPDEAMRPRWADWFRLAGVADVDSSRGPRFSSAVLVLEAALGGQGMALALWPLVEADVRSGRLVVPFPVVLPSRYVYSLVVSEAFLERPVIQAFRSWLLAEANQASIGS